MNFVVAFNFALQILTYNKMEKKNLMNEYRSLLAGNKSQWRQMTSFGEFIWDGVYAVRLLKDAGTLGLPFELSGEEIVNLVVKDQTCDANTQNARVIVQTLTRVERLSGNVATYTRSRRYADGEHKWSEWCGLGGGNSELSVATTTTLGGVKSYNNKGEVDSDPGYVAYGVNVAADGFASITMPEADATHEGVVYLDDEVQENSKAVTGAAVITYVENAVEIPVVNHTSTTVEIAPNVFNVWGEVVELNITLAAGKENVTNEYIIQFTSGDIPTILALPSYIKWWNDKVPVIAENMTYQISILNGLAVFLYFKNSAT